MKDEFGTELTEGWSVFKYSDVNYMGGRQYFYKNTNWNVHRIWDGWICTKVSKNGSGSDKDSLGWQRQEMITPNGHNNDMTNKETDLGSPYYFNTPEEAMAAVNNYLNKNLIN